MTDSFLTLINRKLAELAEARQGVNINRERTVSAMRTDWEENVKLRGPMPMGPRGREYTVFLHGDGGEASGPLLVISRRVLPYPIHSSVSN
jgi:hypothetical protein